MVLPNDVPSFVMRLMALPETSSCTLVCHLRCCEDAVVLLLQVCTHDVTYGENFRTQDTLVFKRDPAGGVIFRKFFEIIWVAPLPWTHAAIKSFVESKAKSSSVVSAEYLVQILQAVLESDGVGKSEEASQASLPDRAPSLWAWEEVFAVEQRPEETREERPNEKRPQMYAQPPKWGNKAGRPVARFRPRNSNGQDVSMSSVEVSWCSIS
mmetsp:Transcript_86901/g.153494  ORF Transcript_86901/g.153494 Transcript_86901/m.153494 type:complete len:210 (-) Transcript_86901:17-646(-)